MSRRLRAAGPARRLLALLALSGLLAAAALQERYDANVDYLGERNAFLALPSGRTLKALSFGYHNLTADLLFIWSIQFYSTYRIRNRFEFIERVYEAITDITPAYKEPYVVGAMIMAFEAQDIPMALRLLEKGSRLNPGEWIFDYEAGYYSYKNLKDYERAEAYYDRAAQRPGAPMFLRRLKAHLVYLRNDPQQAARMWLDILQNAEDTITRDSALNHLYQIKAEADLPRLQERVDAFRRQFRRLPERLDELLAAGLLRELPRDYHGNHYLYDPQSGLVSAQRIFRWKKR